MLQSQKEKMCLKVREHPRREREREGWNETSCAGTS